MASTITPAQKQSGGAPRRGGPVSTRKLIVLALAAGMAILVAFAVQVSLMAR